MLSFGSYFSGGGLADIGAIQAGFTAVFAVEGDPGNWEQSMRIADCYERNIGAHVVRAAVQDVDPADLPAVDWFHASPVCKNASVAKQNAGEQDVDMITARATADYIAEHRPRFVTIENVWGYRKFEAWNLIAKTLTAQGYAFRVDHINMADYGVPQTRKRVWVTAVLNGNRPGLLPPTHEQDPKPSLFGPGLPRWVSWYEAIEDLIPSLPDSEFAPWQLERLPEELATLLMSKDKGEWGDGHAAVDMPAQTVTTADAGRRRAFIASQGSYGDDMPVCSSDSPAHTVTANHNQANLRAFIAPGGNASSFDIRDAGEPSRTIGDTARVGNLPRAFIANGTPSDHGATMTVNGQDDPIFTPTATSWTRPLRAFVMQPANPNSNQKKKWRFDDEPNRTVTAGDAGSTKAYTHGRVVKLTPRAIARLQTFPDHCALPDNDRDAVTMLGNGVPCEFVRLNGVRFMELAHD